MKRSVFFLFAWCCVAAGAAHAVPARPLYVPEPPPKPLAFTPFKLDGTAWLGKYLTATRTFIFEPDGTLSYKTTTKTIFKNRGRWRLDGNILYFEHFTVPNNILMEFRGVVRDVNTIVGESVTRTGVRATQTLQRSKLELK